MGSVPADYAPMHPADDLARCQRYYEMIGEAAQSFAYQGYCAASSAFTIFAPYRVRKAIAPTVTKAATWGTVNCTAQPTTGSVGIDMCYVTATATATAATQFYNNTTPALILEANP